MPYLNRNQIKRLIDEKIIFSCKSINTLQLQPASLDLTISNTCYRIKASFIPNERPISKIISELMLAKIDLSKEFLLERNCIYLCEINEKLKLPKEIKGKANPKSTTGRLDIFTRIITEHGSEYDFIDYNYKGKLYLEIIPQSFSIKIKKNISLNQIRFYKGPNNESTQREQKISVDIKKGTVSAYKAKKITSSIDMSKINYYEKDMYWEKIIPKEDYFIIEKDEFYILRSKEKIIIPNDFAAELEPFNDSFGNFRVHYAGFFDPGFGADTVSYTHLTLPTTPYV